jgi:hypothetical protein
MHRRSFLSMIGLAPVMPLAAVASPAREVTFEPNIATHDLHALEASLGEIRAGFLQFEKDFAGRVVKSIREAKTKGTL